MRSGASPKQEEDSQGVEDHGEGMGSDYVSVERCQVSWSVGRWNLTWKPYTQEAWRKLCGNSKTANVDRQMKAIKKAW